MNIHLKNINKVKTTEELNTELHLKCTFSKMIQNSALQASLCKPTGAYINFGVLKTLQFEGMGVGIV